MFLDQFIAMQDKEDRREVFTDFDRHNLSFGRGNSKRKYIG